MANKQLYLILFTGTKLSIHIFFFILFLFFNSALNIFFFSNAKYIGSPRKATDLQGILQQKLELKCEYNGDDNDGEFLGWYKDDVAIQSDKSEHYAVKKTEKELILIISLGK